jgi:hypothetical protein
VAAALAVGWILARRAPPTPPAEPVVTPADRAEERMLAVRYALLQDTHEELREDTRRRLAAAAESVAALELQLADARGPQAQRDAPPPASPDGTPPADGAGDVQRRITVEFDLVLSERDAAVAEAASLRERAEVAEAAVRVALRELGVDPSLWPLTANSVVRAAGPLTLHALGEDTPGWCPSPADDTLAAAVFHLRQHHAWFAYSTHDAVETFDGESEHGHE